MPLHALQYVWSDMFDAYQGSERLLPQYPWLVANVWLDGILPELIDAPMAWENVIYGSESLGFVNSSHQRFWADKASAQRTDLLSRLGGSFARSRATLAEDRIRAADAGAGVTRSDYCLRNAAVVAGRGSGVVCAWACDECAECWLSQSSTLARPTKQARIGAGGACGFIWVFGV